MKVPHIIYTLTKKVRSNLIPNSHYIVAVSGGADSIALADICANIYREGYSSFTICHIEHGIRGNESLDDMRFVENFCQEKQLPFIGIHVNALEFASKNKLGLEDAARRLRYDELRKVMKKLGADKILTAHQADDQAETVLWRLLRGAGLEGLAGMDLENNDILRPLIFVSRKEILNYLAEKKLTYRVDSTNSDLNYTRNKIRQELLPLLANDYNERIMETLSRTAKILGEDAECLENIAQCEFVSALEHSENEIVLNAKKLQKMLPAISKRVLRIACFKMELNELDYERTQAVYEMLMRNAGNKVIQLPQNTEVILKNGKLVFAKKI